jgi:membrane-associated HD superfamily phosphohydrolase
LKLRLTALLAVIVAALALASSALAFDCIRVSSSLQGLQQSTRSGKWALFNLSSGPALQQSFAALGENVDASTAACVSSGYLASGLSPYFALGFGVAGPNGVLAHNNPNGTVLGNLRGIDHLDESPIGAALFGAAADCGLPVGD